MKKIILKNIQGKKVLFLFILTNLVYAFMLMVTIPKVMHFSGGMNLLDMIPTGYNLEYVNTLFDILGEKGRNTYLFRQIPVDMIYPFLFGISNCLILAYFLKKLNKLSGSLFYLCFLPIVAAIADYLENFGIITMLLEYPNLSNEIATTTSIFSVIKSMTTTIYFVVLIVTLIFLGIKAIRK